MSIFGFGKQQEIKSPKLYEPVWIDNIFTDAEIDEIVMIGEKQTFQDAKVGEGTNGILDRSTRRTAISWIQPDIAPIWFASKLESLTMGINDQHFKWDLLGAEAAQYTKYESNIAAEYKWHCDTTFVGPDIIRKLSCSILLSDPLEYEGGDLILAPTGVPITVGNKKGRAIFFPSWVPHCVTPVMKGTRKSLVIWSHGPAFK